MVLGGRTRRGSPHDVHTAGFAHQRHIRNTQKCKDIEGLWIIIETRVLQEGDAKWVVVIEQECGRAPALYSRDER